MSFCHLHVHSDGSLLDGLSKVKQIAKKAKDCGQTAVALTDHGNIFNAIAFYKACQKEGVKPILGCLMQGQEIITINGYKQVEDIEIGDYVLTHKGRFRCVKNIMSRTYSGKVYEIELNNRYKRKLRLTEEHPILIKNDSTSELKWLKPHEIDYGRIVKDGGINNWKSYVCFPKIRESCAHVYINTINHLPDNFSIDSTSRTIRKQYKTSSKYESLLQWKNISEYIAVDEYMAYLLGLYVAEGSVHHKNNKVTGDIIFSFNINEDEYANKISMILKQKFNLHCTIRKRPEKSIQEVHCCCVPLAHILSNICGCGSHNKMIPEYIYRSSKFIRDSFIKGLIDGDGKNIKEPYSQGCLKVASKKLAWGFKTLIASDNYWSVVADVIEKRDNSTDVYYAVQYNINRKYHRILFDDNYLYKPIKSIRCFKDNTTVYNFEVEEDNSYVSDFVLHNCEFYMDPDTQENKKLKLRETYHLVLLAKNETGWRNIVKMVTLSNQPEQFYYRPRIDYKILEQHSEGVIALTACMQGIVAASLLAGDVESAYIHAGRLHEIFGDSLYFETQNANLDGQKELNDRIREIARHFGRKVVGTVDSHYLNREDAMTHMELMVIGIQNRDYVMNSGFGLSSEFYFKEESEVDLPQEELDNTMEVADRCMVTIDLKKQRFPKYRDNAEELLKEALREGWKTRLTPEQQKDPRYAERAKKEIEDIVGAGFADYFLIIADIVTYAKDSGYWVGPSRGSVAGSLLAFLLRITEVDPIRHDLIFERFYNAGRVGSAPDIDTDIELRYRQDVIKYIKDKFGDDKVSQLMTLNTMAARAALKDIMRFNNVPFDVANKITSLIPMKNDDHTAITLADALEKSEALKEYSEETEYQQCFRYAQKIEGVAKAIGRHAAAVIISDTPFGDGELPLVRSPDGKDVVCGWDMKTIDSLNILKCDVLGLATLEVLHRCCDLIKEHRGIEYTIEDMYNFKFDDEKTYDLINMGWVDGVFQIESHLGKKWAKSLLPRTINDISDLSSLIRPGPLDCLSGDTKILVNKFVVNDTTNGFEYKTIKQLYKEYKKVRYGNFGQRYGGPPKLKICSVDENGLLIKRNKIKRIVASGKKGVYNIKLMVNTHNYNQRKTLNIKASHEHRFLTLSGWKRLKNIKNGDYICVLKKRVGLVNKSNKYAHGWKNFKNIAMQHYQYRCALCDWRGGSLDVHHIEGNRYTNNHPDNLVYLCPNHHRMLCEDKITKEEVVKERNKYKIPQSDDLCFYAVKDIVYIDTVETYDIEMEAPHHNFIAGDFVVHNSGMLEEYNEVRFNRKTPLYIHNDLEPILSSTNGQLVYQEQVLQICNKIANMSLEDADKLRKAMGKKLPEEMAKWKDTFVTETERHAGLSTEDSESIWGWIESFAGYGFNRCFHKGTNILLSDGSEKRIVDLYNEKFRGEVCSIDPKTGYVSREYVEDIRHSGCIDTYKLELINGDHVYVSNGHKFVTPSGPKPLFKLSAGEYIATVQRVDYKECLALYKFQASFLGCILSEGNLCHSSSIYFYSTNELERMFFKHIVEQFDNTTTMDDINKDSVHTKRIDKAIPQGAYEFCRQMGILGHCATEKIIPDVMMTECLDNIGAFLGALWTGDGHVGKTVYYATSSEKMARQVKLLCLKLGIVTSLKKKLFKYKDGRIGYTVSLIGWKSWCNFEKWIAPELFGKRRQDFECVKNKEYKFAGTYDGLPRYFIDEIRNEVVYAGYTGGFRNGKSIKDLCNKAGISHRVFYNNNQKTISYTWLVKLNTVLKSDRINELIYSDIAWLPIKEISKHKKSDVYDITVSNTHTVIADRVLAMNSHGIGYAIISYWTAYFKANYPLEFLCACLICTQYSQKPLSEIKRFVNDAKLFDIKILPPDIRHRNVDFVISDDKTIRFGLSHIKKLGKRAIEQILEWKDVDYDNFYSFIFECPLNKTSVTSLICSGALDCFGLPRDRMLNEYQLYKKISTKQQKIVKMLFTDDDCSVISIIRTLGDEAQVNLLKEQGIRPPNIKGRQKIRALIAEYEGVELLSGDNVLDLEKEYLGISTTSRSIAARGSHTCLAIKQHSLCNMPVHLIAYVADVNCFKTKKTEQEMAFVSFDDGSYMIEGAVIFPQLYREVSSILTIDRIVEIWGKLDETGTLICDRIVA